VYIKMTYVIIIVTSVVSFEYDLRFTDFQTCFERAIKLSSSLQRVLQDNTTAVCVKAQDINQGKNV